MKKLMTALCFILIFSMLLSPAAAAEGKSTDTLVSWGIKITVPEGKTAILKGDEYYIYAKNEGSIPYVMVRVYDFGSEKEFISEFTKYMQKQYKDLKVTSKAAPKTVGDKDCWEIDYAYKVSGYDIADRRIVTTVGERTYMFASKEVASLGLTIGDMLEQVVADCEFLTEEPAPAETDGELADGYLYCLDNGMPKYWLDFTGAVADNLVLHCYFRGSDPTFYESIYILDVATADNTGDTLTIRKVCDSFGFDRSDWFKKLVIREDGNGLVMEVERDNKTLAGGSESALLSGKYPMEPVGVDVRYEYRKDGGMLKYWLDLSEKQIRLHAMFRSGEPEYHEEVFTVDSKTAKMAGDYTIRVGKLFNEKGLDVSGWFKSLTLTEVQGGVNMVVDRDERTLAGGPEDNILSGTYFFEPHSYLAPAHDGPFTPKELCRWAQIRYFAKTGFFPPEADFEKNDDGSYTIHLYEVVDTDGFVHTATSAWYTVDEYGVGVDDVFGGEIRLAG